MSKHFLTAQKLAGGALSARRKQYFLQFQGRRKDLKIGGEGVLRSKKDTF